MQNMVANTASSRIKNRIGKQMIQIYQHRCNHNQPSLFPVVPKENISDKSRKKKMQAIMEGRL